MTLVHLVPGPQEHGVVRHGLGLQEHLAAVSLLRCGQLSELADGALSGQVVVVQVTDRVIAGPAGERLATWRRVLRGAARVTVVLHDLPQASDGASRLDRSRLYAALAADADDVVVASEHERLLLAAVLRWARPGVAGAVLRRTHVVPLPVEGGPQPAAGHARGHGAPDTGELPGVGEVPGAGAALLGVEPGEGGDDPLSVVTLGYLYPGKGVEEVIDAAALAARDPRLSGRRVQVRNLGRASEGHDDLVETLAARAEAAGISWSTSGWVEDADLPRLLAEATVPVAAHRHLSASGSITTWLGARRRPLVLASRYATELAARLPGALTLVPPSGDRARVADADPVAELARALADALADPASTWLADDVELGPTWPEAAHALAQVADRPALSVVIPYYRDQALLDLILERLSAQTGVAGGLEVVVADDGSPQPPTLDALQDAPVRLVRQERDGFRAAAARNLGARHTCGRVLAFLDGDTVPDDGYLAALQGICLDAPTLAVGRRRHTDQLQPWPPATELPEPQWLADGYRHSDDLRAADDGAFRFVISAVMAVSRAVWDAVGGFPELRGYGGEDWELAWRAWLAGADLRHVPEAVAWHDGPDLAGRADGRDAARLAQTKNAETARLAPLLPHPLVRGRGWTHARPDVVVLVRAAGWAPGQLVVVVESLLRQGDVGVWVTGAEAVPADPRVHAGRPPAAVVSSARAVLEVCRPAAVLGLPWDPWPADVTGTLEPGRTPLTQDDASGVRVTGTRHAGRALLHAEPPVSGWLPQEWVEPVDEHVVVERWRQR